MANTAAAHTEHGAHGAKPNTAIIWRTFWILLAITALEFLIAFTMPASMLRVSIFVVMTIIKAFFIVSEFMHLGHETKALIWSILLPCAFVIWLIVALLVEGGSIYVAR